MTTKISGLITNLKNANANKYKSTNVSYSNLAKSVAEFLKQKGYILDYKIIDKNIEIFCKYIGKNQDRTFYRLEQLSKSTKPVYCSYKDFFKEYKDFTKQHGLLVLSTSRGILSHIEAEYERTGGEILFYIA